MNGNDDILADLQGRFGKADILIQPTADAVPTCWVSPSLLKQVLSYLKRDVPQAYMMLYDLFGIDERTRANRQGQPASDFTIVYQLLSLERRSEIRIKVALQGDSPSTPTITDLWRSADWYEREAWDMFGIKFDGHRDLRRILLPPWWQGHALRKEHPSRGTEMAPFKLDDHRMDIDQEQLQFKPERWGLSRRGRHSDFMFLNMGPHHPGTHGLLRLVLQLDGEEIVNVVPDIGFHHRADEKVGERQTWHTFIPYTDRVDYLSGVNNNFPYVLTVEKLCGIEVPDRAKVIRIMLAELYRIASHLVFYGTFAQDLGQMSPVFYMFTDREKVFDVIEPITGGRLHSGWFRIGGVAQDLPEGWEQLVDELVSYIPPRLDEYDGMVMDNPIFKGRTRGIGKFTTEEAVEWSATGPMLRATGLAWDMRKVRPYGGYEQFDFDVATATEGDCYARAVVHIEEMRQSIRIIQQCRRNMPAGPYKSADPLSTPPLKDRTMHDIETLIDHFLSVSWGPVVPPGEAMISTENSKGMNGYYLISDGGTTSYRTRIRTPSFAHIQMVPKISRGLMLSDLIAILGSVDFVLADVDR